MPLNYIINFKMNYDKTKYANRLHKKPKLEGYVIL